MAEMSKIEEVARALCVQMGEDPDQKTKYHPKRNFVWEHYIPSARAAIEAMPLPEITEDTFYEIEEAAAKKMRKWERGYVCQDIRIQHSMAWWIAKEVEYRFRAALSEEVAG